MSLADLEQLAKEGERIFTICNACRYCEGYCAVFPAMERRLEFTTGDMSYLANLCHNCGECYHACQFSPPHEFNLNVPQTLAKIRTETYEQYAWPQPLARAFQRSGAGTAIGLIVVLLAVMFFAASRTAGDRFYSAIADGNFYRIIPHEVMVAMFGAVGLFVLLALVMACARAWRHIDEPLSGLGRGFVWREALSDAFSMRYLHGGGAGCSESDLKRSKARRLAHHLTFYGFLLCFAATVTGTLYHYGLGWPAPYPYVSLPKVLGTLGGLGLLIGPPALWWLRGRMDPGTVEPTSSGPGDALILLLFLTSLTGLALMLARGTPALGMLLVVHLAIVMALFVTMPYGKFVHGFYRLLALAKYALERRRPMTIIGGEG